MSFEQTQGYDEKLVTLLEALWGEGYLSPGGDEETALVLDGLDLRGKAILDLGCGTGGSAFLMAGRYGAGSVLGADVEAGVVRKAAEDAQRRRLAGRVRFETIAPGPLPFADRSFDVVFSKDAIIHIADKHAIAVELFRVLKPGGIFAASDWMAGFDGPLSPAMIKYVEMEGLGFGLAAPERYFSGLRAAGFERIAYRDRTAWYRERTKVEIATLKGRLYPSLSLKVGKDFLDHEIMVWEALAAMLETSELGPGHWRAEKP
jgi:phosphoethanolamine N-methyltransferase